MPDAEQALKREAVLAAIIDAEQIEPTDEELIEAIPPTCRRSAARRGSRARQAARPPAQGRAPR